tara:strand:+ start:1422 stop:2309 length:888 start_codon:yes stop_codon:yes gene_type:complete
MIIIYSIAISLLLGSDSSRTKYKSDFFKDLDLKLNYNPSEILPKEPADKYANFNKSKSTLYIDSIKNIAKNYIPTPPNSSDIIIMETNKGTMKLKYYPDIAEKHCYNFKKLANSGFYDNTLFHRVIKNFMIQGGDILSLDSNRDNDGLGNPGWTIDAEFNNLKHKKGVLSMARGSSINSAGSQFFICHKDAPWLDGKYTVFGEVIDNIHIIDLIANAPTDYTSAISNCHNKIPEGENPKYWIKVQDPKTHRQLFSKIPIGKNGDNYRHELIKNLRSDNPSYKIIIKSIRVVDAVN